MACAILVCVAAFGAFVAASALEGAGLYQRDVNSPSASDYWGRAFHSADQSDTRHEVAVAWPYLYIYGGEIQTAARAAGNVSSSIVNDTLAIPLTDSWTNQTINMSAMGVPPSQLYKRTAVWQDVASASFFLTGGDNGLHGVLHSDAKQMQQFIQYTSGTGFRATLLDLNVANAADFNSSVGMAGAAATTCAGLGLMSGSYASNSTTYPYSAPYDTSPGGLITYNASDAMWRNESILPLAPNFISGEMVCLQGYGVDGLAAFLGGYSVAELDIDTGRRQYFDMSNVTLYDPVSKAWYSQRTTGETPSFRAMFCAVAVTGANSTEIFIYGGESPEGVATSDVWVLSIPLFRWFQLPSGTTRSQHRCAAPTQTSRQMISVGGFVRPNDTRGGWDTRDTWDQGIGVLDLNDLAWVAGFDGGTPQYESSPSIQEWYTPSNLSSIQWSSSATRAIFASSVSALTNTTSTSTEGNISTAAKIGAIVGGVVGGVVVIALGLTWFYWRRRQQSKRLGAMSPPLHATEADGNPIVEANTADMDPDSLTPAPHELRAPAGRPRAELESPGKALELDANQILKDVTEKTGPTVPTPTAHELATPPAGPQLGTRPVVHELPGNTDDYTRREKTDSP